MDDQNKFGRWFWRRIISLKYQARNKKLSSAWTLMEVLIVLGIILLLTATVSFVFVNALDKGRVTATKTQIEAITTALYAYYIDCGNYPTVEQGLSALWEKPTTSPIPENWGGPYLARAVKADPWGNPYQYTPPSGDSGNLPLVFSYGADGLPGGEGINEDILSR